MREIEQIEIVDALMFQFQNGIKPSKEMALRAYELNINIVELKNRMERNN